VGEVGWGRGTYSESGGVLIVVLVRLVVGTVGQVG